MVEQGPEPTSEENGKSSHQNEPRRAEILAPTGLGRWGSTKCGILETKEKRQPRGKGGGRLVPSPSKRGCPGSGKRTQRTQTKGASQLTQSQGTQRLRTRRMARQRRFKTGQYLETPQERAGTRRPKGAGQGCFPDGRVRPLPRALAGERHVKPEGVKKRVKPMKNLPPTLHARTCF